MGGAALALGGRSVVGAGFALPRDAGRRPAFLAPRSIVVGDGRCGSHVGMAQCRRRWFRAPARCRSETGAPGPAVVRGWRCAMRQSRWHGAASSALVSRCRAMPVGDRRSRRRACSRLAMGDAAVTLAWRSVVGAGFALPRDAGRRPALQVAALVCGWRCAMRQSGWQGAASSVLVSRCRAMPVGDRRSNSRACSGLAMRDAAVTLAWRSVVRAGFALPRDAGRRPALQVAALVRGWRWAMRQSRWHGAALSALVSRCRAMPVGDRRSRSRACLRLAMRDAAIQVGRAQRHRCWFRAAARCRSETGAPIPAVVRGWRCAMRQSGWQGAALSGAGFALPRDAGRRPALQFPRLFGVGDARCGNQVGRAQRCRRWFRAAARCRSEDRRCLRFRRRGRRVRKGPRPRSRGECRRRRPPGRRRPGRSSRPAGGWRS